MMLHPRIAVLNGKEVLVDDTQCVNYREYLADKYRILFLTGAIDGQMENNNLLLALDSLSNAPIKMIITSPGGDLDSAFLLYDTLRLIKSPLITVGRFCASAAALLLAAGNKRYLFPHAKIMLHLPAGQMGGDAKDWDIQHKQMEKYRNRVVELLIECGAKKSQSEILSDIDRDFWMEPKEAIDYGLADEILTTDIWDGWLKGGRSEVLPD